MVRAEASNLESFFQIFGGSVAALAKLSSMESWDAETIQDLDTFVEQWRQSNLIGGVSLLDGSGKVRLNSNVSGTRDTGVSLADRDYFLWAKQNEPEIGEYFVGQAVVSRIGATKGKIIVPVATPVYQKGVFVGAVVSSVVLQSLAERYLDLMKVSDQTEVYLVGSSGDLLYDNTGKGTVGSNIFETGHPFLGSQPINDAVKDVLSKDKNGNFRIEDRLVAYSPIQLSGRNWALIMTSPVEKVAQVVRPFYIRQVAMLLLVSLAFLLFGLVSSEKIKF